MHKNYSDDGGLQYLSRFAVTKSGLAGVAGEFCERERMHATSSCCYERWLSCVVTIGESGETGRAEMVSCLLDWRANPELRGMDKEFKACDNALG